MSEKLKKLLGYILDRLGENSTWRGIFGIVAASGIYEISDATAAKVTAAALLVISAINIFRQGAPTKSEVIEALATKQDKP